MPITPPGITYGEEQLPGFSQAGWVTAAKTSPGWGQHEAAGARAQEDPGTLFVPCSQGLQQTGGGKAHRHRAPRWDGPPSAHPAGLAPVIPIAQAQSKPAEATRAAHDNLF